MKYTENKAVSIANNNNKGKTVGVFLSDDDLLRLNFFLQKNNFPTLGKFIKAVLDKQWPIAEQNEQTEKLLERIRDRGIKDPLTGDFNVDFYKNIDKEDMLRDFYRKYVYKKHARDLAAYYNRYVDIFFTKPHLIQPLSGHVRAWICDAMRRFAEYYDRKYQNPEVKLLIDEIIKRYELNKKMRIHDRVWLADEKYIENTVNQILKVDGEIGTIIKFAFFSGLRSTEIIYCFDTGICPNLSGCNCDKLHVMNKTADYSVIVLNRIVGQKHAYFTIIPTELWNIFRNLPIKITKQEMNIAHEMVKSVTNGKAILMDLRKFHYNILCRSDMGEQGAEVLAGRARSISAKHYLIHELDKMVEQYGDCMGKFISSHSYQNESYNL